MSHVPQDDGQLVEMYSERTDGEGAPVTAWAQAAGVAVREVVSWMGGAQSADWDGASAGGGSGQLFGAASGAVDVTSFISGLLAVPLADMPAAPAAAAVAPMAPGRAAAEGRVDGWLGRRPTGVAVGTAALLLAVGGLVYSVVQGR